MFSLIDESRFTPEEIHEIRRRLDVIEWERHLLDIISSGEGLSVILNELALSVETVIPNALGSLMLLGADGRRLHFGSAPNLPAEFVQAVAGPEIGTNSGSCGTAAYLKEAVLVSDISEDPRWSSLRHFASPYGLRACWSFPIFSRKRRVLGTFAVYFKEPRVAASGEVSILERAAHYAAAAIEIKGEEQELRAMTQLLIDAKSVVQVGTWRLELASNLVTLSAEVCQVFGLSHKALVYSLEFLLSLVHPEDVAMVIGWLNASRAYEEPGVLDFRLLPDGRDIRIIRAQCSLIHDEQHQPYRLLGTVQDVTEGRLAEARAEAVLRARESQMELMFESSTAGACLATLDGYFLKVNPALCSIVGFSEAELLNLSVREITYPDDIPKIFGAMEAIIQGQAESFELEKRCIHKNGLLVWCLVSITLVRDAQGS
ncbi:MAG: PAS domain-containing protein, partial [Verrucomicrobiota bacterium]